MSYRKLGFWSLALLISLLALNVVADERVEFRRPTVGSFAWQEMSSITASAEGEPDSPDHMSQATIVVNHHKDGGIDMMNYGQSGLSILTIVQIDANGHIVRGKVFPTKREIYDSEVGVSLYPQLPGRAVLVGESWALKYGLDEDHMLQGKMLLKGQITMQPDRPWWVIDFTWEGTVAGVWGQPNPNPEVPKEFKYMATGKYAMDSVTNLTLPLQARMEYKNFVTFTLETESLEFGVLPEMVVSLLQQAYQALEEDRLDDAEARLQQCSEAAPDIPWLAGMSDSVRMPERNGR